MVAKIKLKRLYKPYSQTLFLLFILKYFYYFTIILVFIPNTLHHPCKEGLILILINNKCNYKSLSVNSISLNSKSETEILSYSSLFQSITEPQLALSVEFLSEILYVGKIHI